ncbi:MAG: GNAT family N-acetyltransferase [Candidatus Sulfotelmatobacter sp.]
MEIRFLQPDDANEWWRLRLESLQGDPEAFSSSPEDHQSLTLEDVRKRLGSQDADFFVVGALEDGRVIGMAGFYREKGRKTRHKGRVWGVYVTPQRRGEGIGRKMLKTLLERGEGIDGVEQILIAVTSTQAAAAGLYRSLGFEVFGHEPRALKVGDCFIDEEYMVRWVGGIARQDLKR